MLKKPRKIFGMRKTLAPDNAILRLEGEMIRDRLRAAAAGDRAEVVRIDRALARLIP